MSDEIRLIGLRAVGHHGVFPDEKRNGQEFIVDVVLHTDLRAAGATDDLSETIHYGEVADDVVARITGPSYDLIEALAERIAEDALARDRVAAVEVTVHKPSAPIPHHFSDVLVHVRRERDVPVVIALGANLSDPARTLAAAVHDLREVSGLTPVAVSPLVETDPVGGPDQPVYLNAVLLARTSLAPDRCWRPCMRSKGGTAGCGTSGGGANPRPRPRPVRHPGVVLGGARRRARAAPAAPAGP